ncbi:probable serine/threonine-protein kinase At1g54610 [Olea europaea var. sylvestris]|uniref:probable serine/threonine-protein kinase At1g54610 n=1 Tax=Olea europaea var. sylvestris TaxID=158386 RepID=UPI000C1CCE97|nr:probable serine/threonine-protein kinase At1g54610 [Olea europaea var. sylvestris]
MPYSCDPSSLPKYPPSKEIDAKRRDEEARRLRVAGKAGADGVRKTRQRDRARAIPAPGANAELQTNIDVCILSTWNFMCICIIWIPTFRKGEFVPRHFTSVK